MSLELRRVHKEAIWDPSYPAPIPIARRRARIPIPERIDHTGAVLLPLDEEAVRRGAFEGVMRNYRGEIAECTTANIFIVKGGAARTPPLDAGLLPGTYRTVLLREGLLTERPVPPDELFGAEELALVSSVRGWRTAVLVP